MLSQKSWNRMIPRLSMSTYNILNNSNTCFVENIILIDFFFFQFTESCEHTLHGSLLTYKTTSESELSHCLLCVLSSLLFQIEILSFTTKIPIVFSPGVKRSSGWNYRITEEETWYVLWFIMMGCSRFIKICFPDSSLFDSLLILSSQNYISGSELIEIVLTLYCQYIFCVCV